MEQIAPRTWCVTLPSTQSKEAIDRLVDALLAKRVIPFLGAGFSYGARHARNGWSSESDLMPGQLQQWLDAELEKYRERNKRFVTDRRAEPDNEMDRNGRPLPAGVPGHPQERLHDHSRCASNDDRQRAPEQCVELLDKLLENHTRSPSLCHLAELGSILFGPAKVCEVLKIHEYADLRPQPQHRYLAYLAREGLINEVITTNYDCCIETAFQESFYPTQSVPGVVRNVEEYRHEASARRADGDLVVYKINGCAKAYARARTVYNQARTSENLRSWEAEANRIILTERQLQNFRGRDWAQDLVRDRFRSRCLFFSGFGNDEPQIRHTVLTLVSEFGQATRTEQRPPEESFDLPNAPILHSYDGTLSFNQLQMLVAFMDAHAFPRFAGDIPGRLVPLFRNVIAPKKTSCASTDEAKEALCLKASTLMRDLFQEVFGHLVANALRDGEPFAIWLRDITSEWRLWTSYLLRIVQRKQSSALRRRMCEMLSTQDNQFPLVLYRNLWAILYPEARPNCPRHCPTDWYVSLRENPLFVLQGILWLCMFQACRRRRPEHRPKPTAFGLRVRLRRGDKVYLIAREALQELQTNAGKEEEGRLLRMVVIPTLRKDVDAWGRWRVVRNGRVVPGRWVAVDSADIVRAARRPEKVLDRLWDAFAAVTPRQPAARLRLVASS